MHGVCFFSKCVLSSFILTLALQRAAWQWEVSVWAESRVGESQGQIMAQLCAQCGQQGFAQG